MMRRCYGGGASILLVDDIIEARAPWIHELPLALLAPALVSGSPRDSIPLR
jgi:hypothetical protein